MKKTIKTFKSNAAVFALIAGLCGLSVTAQATLIETHEGLELDAAMITLPSSENGSLTVQQCDECDRLRLKTSPDTTNFVIRDESGNSEVISLRRLDHSIQGTLPQKGGHHHHDVVKVRKHSASRR